MTSHILPVASDALSPRSENVSLLINIDVDDLGHALDFYPRAFGLRIGRRFDAEFVELVGANARIYLLVKPSGSKVSPGAGSTRHYARHWTPVHLDLVVEDIEAAVERALEAGATLEGPIEDHDYGRLAMFGDPFGHGFCLLQFTGRGYDELITA
jgi:predicted enzyme related to lactoylglutathione lyase